MAFRWRAKSGPLLFAYWDMTYKINSQFKRWLFKNHSALGNCIAKTSFDCRVFWRKKKNYPTEQGGGVLYDHLNEGLCRHIYGKYINLIG